MRTLLYIFILSITLSLLYGCAEPNDPIYPEAEFALRLLSQTQTPGWAEDVWVDGDLAFIADGEQGVTIWNISDPSSPVLIDVIPVPESATLVRYAPMTKFVIVNKKYGAGGASVWDFDTKARRFNLWDSGIEDLSFVEISTDTIIVSMVDWDEGFKLRKIYYDTTYNSWMEDELGGLYDFLYGTPRGLHLEQYYAYVGHNHLGLDIMEIDYSVNPIEIRPFGNVDTPGGAVGVALSGDKSHAYVADMHGGLQLIDVTDKQTPAIVGEIVPERVDQAFKVTAVGDTVYFLDKYNGVYVVDARDPSEPRLIGKYDTPSPSGVFVNEEHTIFIADEELGLVILDWW